MAGLDKFLYNFARRYAIPMVKFEGRTETVSVALSVYSKDPSNKILICSGLTVPTDATSGFAKGCLFIKTSAATGVNGIYINVGTSTSCIFTLLPYVPWVSGDAAVYAMANSATVTAANIAGKNVTNTGAGAGILITLPAVATMKNVSFRVQVTVAQVVDASLAATGVYLGGSGAAGKYLRIAGVIGNYADIFCDGTAYHVTGYSGVLTKEA